jgi:hypothetical protein
MNRWHVTEAIPRNLHAARELRAGRRADRSGQPLRLPRAVQSIKSGGTIGPRPGRPFQSLPCQIVASNAGAGTAAAIASTNSSLWKLSTQSYRQQRHAGG